MSITDFFKDSVTLKNIFRCNLETWAEPSLVPRNELLQKVVGIDALFCTLSDKIDAELLDAAGSNLKIIGTMSVG